MVSREQFQRLSLTVCPLSGPSRIADSIWWTDASRKRTSTVRTRRKPAYPAWSGISPWTCQEWVALPYSPKDHWHRQALPRRQRGDTVSREHISIVIPVALKLLLLHYFLSFSPNANQRLLICNDHDYNINSSFISDITDHIFFSILNEALPEARYLTRTEDDLFHQLRTICIQIAMNLIS